MATGEETELAYQELQPTPSENTYNPPSNGTQSNTNGTNGSNGQTHSVNNELQQNQQRPIQPMDEFRDATNDISSIKQISTYSISTYIRTKTIT